MPQQTSFKSQGQPAEPSTLTGLGPEFYQPIAPTGRAALRRP
jgi:hypothetical protein